MRKRFTIKATTDQVDDLLDVLQTYCEDQLDYFKSGGMERDYLDDLSGKVRVFRNMANMCYANGLSYTAKEFYSLVEMIGPLCKGCGRQASVCSEDPCEVVADREATVLSLSPYHRQSAALKQALSVLTAAEDVSRDQDDDQDYELFHSARVELAEAFGLEVEA